MTTKVFYNPFTLEIVGFSDGDDSMIYPFIETEYDLAIIGNFKIQEIEGNLEVVPIKLQYTNEEWEQVINQ
jgi:hypothetical protein